MNNCLDLIMFLDHYPAKKVTYESIFFTLKVLVF